MKLKFQTLEVMSQKSLFANIKCIMMLINIVDWTLQNMAVLFLFAIKIKIIMLILLVNSVIFIQIVWNDSSAFVCLT